MLAFYGLPEEEVSDKGLQFTSIEFQRLLKANGVKQTLVPAYHPDLNGTAERSVQTVKSSLMKQALEVEEAHSSVSVQHRLLNLFPMYRSTPHTVTGCSPVELFC